MTWENPASVGSINTASGAMSSWSVHTIQNYGLFRYMNWAKQAFGLPHDTPSSVVQADSGIPLLSEYSRYRALCLFGRTMGSPPLCCERDKIYAIEGHNEYRRLTVIGARRLLADDTGGEPPEATSGTAVNDADCHSVHIAPWPRCVFAAVCRGDFDHLLDGSEATRQWLSDIHDVWPDGLSEQEWISSTVKVVDPSIDQRVVIRGGRSTLQPLTPQQRWERGTAKWLVLLHSQRLERRRPNPAGTGSCGTWGWNLPPSSNATSGAAHGSGVNWCGNSAQM